VNSAWLLNRRLSRACALLLLLLGSVLSQPVFAKQSGETEVWLLSYGPGEIYWQRFGHNAIWIRDTGLGLDHTFNFGFFDFEQENFFLRFLQGRMLYFSAAQPAREEFAVYINENRSIRAQKLDLSADQKLRLLEYLLAEIRPENRDYLYDYYNNNCSTRVRDALDLALDGALLAEFNDVEAPQTWRDHTRRLTWRDFWLYLGLETGLGAPVDRTITRWDEMFLPEKLAQGLSEVELTVAGLQRPLVLEDAMLYQSTVEQSLSAPQAWWPRYLLASLALVLGSWLLGRILPAGFPLFLARGWLTLSGLAGLSLLFFWFGTDHVVARPNLNVVILNPLWLFLAFWKGREKLTFLMVAGMSVPALLWPFLPPGQYNLDVLAAIVPLNLAAAFTLYRLAAKPG